MAHRLEKTSPLLILSILAMILLLISSVAGIVSDDGGRPYHFTSLRGESVEIYGGQGLYQYDNTLKAVIFRGFDWVNLILVLPLFVVGIYRYRRGQLRGRLLLAALFIYLAYDYLIGVMGNAFNSMFLVWTALFSIGFFGLLLILGESAVSSLPEKLGPRFPRKSVSVYMVVVGLFLLFQYLAEIIAAYATGQPPASLDHYTTLELAALELSIMVPLHLVAGASLWSRKAWGYLISTLLAFTSAMVFIALSVSAVLLYLSFGRGDAFDLGIPITLALVATGFSLVIFKRIKD
jgi:hypothetical protein